MADLDKTKPVSLENLMVSTLAMADSVTKLLIEKGLSRRRVHLISSLLGIEG